MELAEHLAAVLLPVAAGVEQVGVLLQCWAGQLLAAATEGSGVTTPALVERVIQTVLMHQPGDLLNSTLHRGTTRGSSCCAPNRLFHYEPSISISQHSSVRSLLVMHFVYNLNLMNYK